jgi:hypothetical protein
MRKASLHSSKTARLSKMKDFYDVWICSTHLDFNSDTLLEAINATFRNREDRCACR